MELKKQSLELAILSTEQKMRKLAADLPKVDGLPNDLPVAVQPLVPDKHVVGRHFGCATFGYFDVQAFNVYFPPMFGEIECCQS